MMVYEILAKVSKLQLEEDGAYREWKRFAHRDDIPNTIESLYNKHREIVRELYEFMNKDFIEA